MIANLYQGEQFIDENKEPMRNYMWLVKNIMTEDLEQSQGLSQTGTFSKNYAYGS